MKKSEEVTKYIAAAPDWAKPELHTLRAMLEKLLPEGEECISYAIPSYKYKGKYVFHFSANKKHIGLYPAPAAIDAFAHEPGLVRTGKGTLQVVEGTRVPSSVIARIVEWNIKRVDSA